FLPQHHYRPFRRRRAGRDRGLVCLVRSHPPMVHFPSRVLVSPPQIQVRRKRRRVRSRRSRGARHRLARGQGREGGGGVPRAGRRGPGPHAGDRICHPGISALAAPPHVYRGHTAVYNRYGRRDNIHKARIKILVKERGPEKFREEVDAEWAHLKDGPATLIPEEVARIESRFTRPSYLQLPATDAGLDAALATDRTFANWHK